jgi:hypothetical protein
MMSIKTIMKTSVTLSLALCWIVSFATAQIYAPRGSTGSNQAQNSSSEKSGAQKHVQGGWNGSGYGNVTLAWGGGPSYYQGYNYYGNPVMSYKKSARFSLRAAGLIINDAVNFNSWNDMYSPILAKAIRHYQFSRQLYYWRDYAGAYAHAERARYLAWHSLQFFNSPAGGYIGEPVVSPDPYGDPYDPYYRKSNTENNTNGDGGITERKAKEKLEFPKSDPLDEKLPSGKSDKEMIRSFQKADPAE